MVVVAGDVCSECGAALGAGRRPVQFPVHGRGD